MNGAGSSPDFVTEADGPVAATSLQRIGATVLLFIGSVLAYVFILPILAHIWRSEVRLQHPIFAVFGGAFLWLGARTWTGWRFSLGVIWLLFAGLAFFNSTYYRKVQSEPELLDSPRALVVLDGMSKGSITLGIIALTVATVFILAARCGRGREREDRRTPLA
jgi:hypothetical protein